MVVFFLKRTDRQPVAQPGPNFAAPALLGEQPIVGRALAGGIFPNRAGEPRRQKPSRKTGPGAPRTADIRPNPKPASQSLQGRGGALAGGKRALPGRTSNSGRHCAVRVLAFAPRHDTPGRAANSGRHWAAGPGPSARQRLGTRFAKSQSRLRPWGKIGTRCKRPPPKHACQHQDAQMSQP